MKRLDPETVDTPAGVDPNSSPEIWALMTEFFFSSVRPRIVGIARELDLNPPHAMLLLKLDEPQSMGQLADFMNCDNSHITGLVKRLEQKEFVVRNTADHDRRVKMIELTRKGRAARKSVVEAKRQPLPALEELGERDRKLLGTVLRKLVEHGR